MNKNRQRRMLGALLGGTFWAAIGLGLGGFWHWLYLLGVPTRHSLEGLIPFIIGAVAGTAWGLLAAWPQRWLTGALLNTGAITLPVLLPTAYSLLRYHGNSFNALITLGRLFLLVLLSLLLAGLFRGILALALSAFRRGQRAGILGVSLTAVLLCILGLALVWPLDQVEETVSRRRAILQAVHHYAQAQGWEAYTLELEFRDSAYSVVRVDRDQGESHVCTVSPGAPLHWQVTCEP